MRVFITILFFITWLNASAQLSAENDSQFIANIKLEKNIACSPVQDQSQSPTCWVFGTNSLFETDLLKNKGIRVNLSEMFIARYAYIEKAQQFLRTKGKTYFAGGGQFRDVIRIIKKHGIVPQEAYNGMPAGEYYHNHNALDTSMKDYVQKLLSLGRSELSVADHKNLSDTLDKYLGKVPAKFVYKHKLYTAKTFLENYLELNPDDYIDIVSFSDKPYYKKFMLADKYNWSFDSLYNVSLSDMEMIVDSALGKGYTLGWEGDVTNAGFGYLKGLAMMDSIPEDYDSARLANYRSEVTERDHMLHLTGIALDEDKQKWFYLKNSWGETNVLQGYMFMSPAYFRSQTVIIMVNKNALPAAIAKKILYKN